MNNLESQKLQYAMEAHLRSLGWNEVEIIDEDLGRSAGGSVTLEALQQNDAEQVAALPEPLASVELRARPARRPLPAHLPREVRTYPPKQEACPDCGGELKHLGEDVSEMLEIESIRFKVIRQVRPKMACGGCDRIVQAEAPSRPIARGVAGPGLLAHVLASKFADHLPLYRQSEIYARQGLELDRSTLADWVCGTSQLFEPLVEALRRHVMAAQKLHADDTPVPVLAPGNGKTKTGRLSWRQSSICVSLG
jgi:transposase